MDDTNKIEQTLATSPLATRIAEMNKIGSVMGKFAIHEAEKFFLAVKDLLFLADTKTQGAVHKFMNSLLRTHPKLMELQGNRIFKAIRLAKTNDDTKLKAFQLYVENCSEYIMPSKGFFMLIQYFFTHLSSQPLSDILVFLANLQQKRPKGDLVLMNEVVLSIILDKMQISIKKAKNDKQPARDYSNENLGTLLGICEMGLQAENVNIGVIEHIAVILSLAINYKRDDALRIFTSIMKSDYSYYATTFLLGLLHNAKMVDIKSHVMNRDAVLKKKAEPILEYSYKILTESTSISAQEYLTVLTEESFMNEPKLTEYVEHARDRLVAGAIFLIGKVLLLVPKKQWCRDLTLETIIKAYNSTIRQSLRKSALQVMLTFEWIIIGKPRELDEEWGLIFEFIHNFVRDKYLRAYKEGIEDLQKVFSAVRNAYISGVYRGNTEKLMETYLEVKELINDPMFDMIYMNYLKMFSPEVMEQKLEKLLDLAGMLKMKENEELKAKCDLRMAELLGAVENFYLDVKELDKREILENMVVTKSTEWASLPFSVECRLKIIQLLKAMALNTLSHDVFHKIIRSFVGAIYRAQDDTSTVKVAPPKPVTQSLGLAEEIVTGKAAHKALFQLFYDYYLKFPPVRLMHVLNGFVDSLQVGNKVTKLLSLEFFSTVTYDHEYYLNVSQWNVRSHLNANENAGCSFSPQKIATAIAQFMRPEMDKELIMAAIEVLLSMAKNHYALYGIDLAKLLEQVVSVLGHMIKMREVDIALKIVEFLALIICQKGSPTDSAENQLTSLTVACPLLVFGESLAQLDQIAAIFKVEIEEFKKSKVGKKLHNFPQRFFQEIGVFQKPSYQKLAKLAKSLMQTICKTFYVSRSELLSLIEVLIGRLKMYTSDHILAERFASTIQDTISHLYYSGFIGKLTTDNLVNLLDICLQLGWRNTFYLSDQLIPPLQEYLKGKTLFSTKSFFAETPEFSQAEHKGGIAASQLTFPGGETGRKMLEELDARFKVKGKSAESSGAHFGYQNDSFYVMHQTVTNIMRLFLGMSKTTRADVLPYLSRIMAQEAKNEQSLVLQQSLIISELIAWYCFSNVERKVNASNPHKKGKLWLLNDSIIYIETEGQKASVEIRNLVSHNTFTMEFQEPVLKAPKTFEENREDLAKLRRNVKTIENPKEIPPIIGPEHIISNIPFALYLRVNEKTPGWNPVEITSEIEALITSLDEVPVHDTHSIAVLYVPPECEFTELALYSVKTWSDRFERFLSGLGTLINVKECYESYYCGAMPRNGADGLYGIAWRDELSQIFFHVNVLMQHIEETANKYRSLRGKVDPQEEAMVTQMLSSVEYKEENSNKDKVMPMDPEQLQKLITHKIKRHVDGDRVWIIWNESNKEVPMEFLKSRSTAIFIIVTPQVTNYCKKIKEKRTSNKYASTNLGEECIILHEAHLAKPVLKAAIKADLKAQKAAQSNYEKQMYESNFLKRAGIIKDIKRKAWFTSKIIKK